MKILLVYPGKGTEAGRKGKWFFSYVPYGLQLVAAVTPREHEVTVSDETIGDEIDFNAHYDLVGISAMTVQAPRAYEIADAFRKKGVKVAMGGMHASLLPEEAINHCDAVCIGEGEETWPMLLKDLGQGKVSQFYRSEKMSDINSLPWPRRDIFSRKKYGVYNVVMTSRGCPFNCSFCSVVKFFGNNYRFRPVEDIVNEIKAVKERGELDYKMVYFMDDNIVGNPKRAKELFRALIPLKIQWMSQCSINIANDDELLALAKESGGSWLQIGFESVSDSSLTSANKKIANVSAYVEAIKKIHAHKLQVFGLFIFGFDSDTKDIFDKTLKFINDNNVEYATFTVMTPLPGTSVYDQCESEGRLLHKKWDLYDTEHVVMKPKLMTIEELQEGFCRTYKKMYSFRSIFKRSWFAHTGFFVTLTFNFLMKWMIKPPKRHDK